MEDQLSQLWVYAHTIAGAAIGGFAFLFAKIWELQKNLKDSLELKTSIEKINKSVEKMEGALLGTYDKPDGLVQKHQELWKKVQKIEDYLEKGISHDQARNG